MGVSGAGNEQIAYEVTKLLDNFNKDDFVLIVFSNMLRACNYNFLTDEYVRANKNEHQYAKRSPVWQTDMMLLYLHSQLEYRNIPHMFMNSFEPINIYSKFSYEQLKSMNYYKPEYLDNTLFNILLGKFLQKKNDKLEYLEIDPRKTRIFTKFKDYEDNKYISPCYHPTPEGHILIADTLIPIITEYENYV
jgi:hypothetical protein